MAPIQVLTGPNIK